MEIKYTKSLDNGFAPMLAMTDVQLDYAKGVFNLAMGLWEDETFSTPLASDAIINVPEPFYVAIVLGNGGENLVTSMERCWATPRYVPHFKNRILNQLNNRGYYGGCIPIFFEN